MFWQLNGMARIDRWIAKPDDNKSNQFCSNKGSSRPDDRRWYAITECVVCVVQ